MGYLKYYLAKKQVSFDSGVTWVDVEPLEMQVSGSPIDAYESYSECVHSGYRVRATYSDGRIHTTSCDDNIYRVTDDDDTKPSGYDSTAMVSVEIGNCIEIIGDYSFSGCSSLSSVTIGESVITIESKAFFECTNLTEIYIPDNVIQVNGFESCSNLSNVRLSNNAKVIGGFSKCTSLSLKHRCSPCVAAGLILDKIHIRTHIQ